ncbi:MAG: helix-turn-helix transcriptional regulator [Clostridiales bacterium]|nr:helix-turn-helix transcriptional regulator [Clostridiales bacterium]
MSKRLLRLKQNIKNLMKEYNIPQSKIADVTGASQPQVSKSLKMDSNTFFSVEELFAIADFFQVSVDALSEAEAPISGRGKSTPGDICKTLVSICDSEYGIGMGRVLKSWKGNGFKEESATGVSISRSVAVEVTDWPLPDSQSMTSQLTSSTCLALFLDAGAFANDFVDKVKRIKEMYNCGQLDQEMYDVLLQKYLNDVRAKGLAGKEEA